MTNSMMTRPAPGFTLLEVLVAITIFSIMSIVALTGIKSIMDSQALTDKVVERITQLQKTFFYLEQDLRYTLDRNVRNEFGDNLPALVASNTGTQGLALTRMGVSNPQGLLRSSLVRIRYLLKENTLVRTRYSILDGAGDSNNTSLDRNLIDQLEELEFRFLQTNKEWTDNWPPINPVAGEKPLPRAVEIKLTHETLGKVSRIVVLPGS